MVELSFRTWLAFSIEQARYNRDALDSKADEILTAVLERYDTSSTPAQAEPVAVEGKRICSVCTAVVASYPEGMCCHCHELPWPLAHPPAPPQDREAVVARIMAAFGAFTSGEADVLGDIWVYFNGVRQKSFRDSDEAHEYADRLNAQAALDAALPLLGAEERDAK